MSPQTTDSGAQMSSAEKEAYEKHLVSRRLIEEAIGDKVDLERLREMALKRVHPSRYAGVANGTDKEAIADLHKFMASSESGITSDQISTLSEFAPFPQLAKMLPYMPDETLHMVLKRSADAGQPIPMDHPALSGAEFEVKKDRLRNLFIDFDKMSPSYKNDIVQKKAEMDHRDSAAPFAVGFRNKEMLKKAMGRVWGDIEEKDVGVLDAKYEDFVIRAEAQRLNCIRLYDHEYGADAPNQAKFNDSFHAYLFLSARASATMHLALLRRWHDEMRFSGVLHHDPNHETLRKAMGAMKSIPAVVATGQQQAILGDRFLPNQKNLVNVRDSILKGFLDAHLAYLPAFANMAPWLAMEWFMVPGEDRQGLSFIEIELNLRLARCALGLRVSTIANAHIKAVLRHAFVTNEQMAEAAYLHLTVLRKTKNRPTYQSRAGTEQMDTWMRNTLALNSEASTKPPTGRWYPEFTAYTLDEKIKRLRALSPITHEKYGIQADFWGGGH